MAAASTSVYEYDSVVRGQHIYKSVWTSLTVWSSKTRHSIDSLTFLAIVTNNECDLSDVIVKTHKCIPVHGRQCRAGEIGPAAPVLAGPVFLKVKAKFHFCKRQVINKVLV